MTDDTTPAQETPPIPPGFDFWLGTWDLAWEPDGRATNEITATLDGRVVVERFDGRPSTPLQGMSLSVYDAVIGRWRQTWVDNQGSYLDFTGGMEGDRMVMRRQTEQGILQRMVWSDIASDSLSWSWERSQDGGDSWQVLWAIRYRRQEAGDGL